MTSAAFCSFKRKCRKNFNTSLLMEDDVMWRHWWPLVACRLPGFAQKVIYAPRRIAGWSSSLCSVAACNLSCTLTVSLYSLLHATHCATEQSTAVHGVHCASYSPNGSVLWTAGQCELCVLRQSGGSICATVRAKWEKGTSPPAHCSHPPN